MAPSADKCPLCAGPANVVAERAPGYQAGRQFSILECTGCRSSFAAPLAADDAVYGHIYENIRFVPGYNRYHHYAEEVLRQKHALDYLSRQEESYWAVARQVRERRSRTSRSRVLEVGCGLGYFTYALAKDGFDVSGVDISSKAIAWAREHYGPYYAEKTLGDLKAQAARYDMVIMNQLIEHVPDVHPFLDEALDLLAEGGELIATTPNKSAFPGAIWETDLPPVHLWWFAEESLRHLASSHGCTASFVDFKPFTDAYVRVKEPCQDPLKGKPVLDEQGAVLMRQQIPPVSSMKRALEQVGALELTRSIRAAVQGRQRWRGSQGPILAAIFQRAG